MTHPNSSHLRRAEDSGFSFVELLAYMAIAALLILSAVPQFNAYRTKATVTNMRADIRNVATAIEAELTTTQTYVAALHKTGKTVTIGDRAGAPIITVSDPGTTLFYGSCAWCDEFTLAATNPKAPGLSINYKSARGGIVADSTAPEFPTNIVRE